MNNKILFVDDEINILRACRRSLRKTVPTDIAICAEEGLELIQKQGPYAVICSDMRMPGMNGADFLAEVKHRSPDSTRIMLTGNADVQTAMDAVNKGEVFAFLNKPCPPEELTSSILKGIEQYEKITAEKQLLQETLKGSVQVLSDILSLVNPAAFGRTNRLQETVKSLAKAMHVEYTWQMETAVLLSQIGCVILPDEVINHVYEGQALSEEERQLYLQHACLGADMLNHIPRLEEVVATIRYQEKCFNGKGFPKDGVVGTDIPIGARFLKVALDIDLYEMKGMTRHAAVLELFKRQQRYDPDVLERFLEYTQMREPINTKSVHIRNLRSGRVLATEVRTLDGVLLVARGTVANPTLIKRLTAYVQTGKIADEVTVLCSE